jgi:hypothetical protein
MQREYRFKLSGIIFIMIALSISFAGAINYVHGSSARQITNPSPGGTVKTMQLYQDLFELSQKEKRGLTFYVKGQTIAGIVTKLIGEDAVEVRNQTFSRIVIRLDQIDAVAVN